MSVLTNYQKLYRDALINSPEHHAYHNIVAALQEPDPPIALEHAISNAQHALTYQEGQGNRDAQTYYKEVIRLLQHAQPRVQRSSAAKKKPTL